MASDDRDDEQDDGTDLVPRSHIRGLEEKAKRADELERQVEQLTRESVFAQALAGIDHPGLSYFKSGYDGDLTPEAIRQAALEAGFGHEPATEPDQPTPPPGTPQPSDLAAHQRMAAAQAGAAPAPPFDPIEAMNQAQTVEEVMAIVEAHGEKYGVTSSRTNQ
jgi:hypothetical protein